MKDEKMGMCPCGHHHGGKHIFMVLGSVAFVYGLMTYCMSVYGWPGYTAWMVGGLLLIGVGWLKKWLWMKKSM